MKNRKVKTTYGTPEEGIRQIATIVNDEPTFSVTLTSSASATTVTCALVGENSVITFMPKTANAATDLNSMFISASAKSKGSFIITHASNGNTDRTFDYFVYG